MTLQLFRAPVYCGMSFVVVLCGWETLFCHFERGTYADVAREWGAEEGIAA